MTANTGKGEKPCVACPWTKKGRPDITPDVFRAAEGGTWFCCHVNLGTCWGAAVVTRKAAVR